MRRVMLRGHWYGAVIASSLCFIVKAGTKGIDEAAFLGGWLAAILLLPLMMDKSTKGRWLE